MRILFTGGTGKAGRHVVPYLLGKGHRILNVDQCAQTTGIEYERRHAGSQR